MDFQELIKSINYEDIINFDSNINFEVKSISKDSRLIIPDSIFCAISSDVIDGHLFILDAIKNKAKVVICEKLPEDLNKDVIYIKVKDSAFCYSNLSYLFFDKPGLKANIISITGTNGKTTTTYLLESILKNNNCNVGIIGTVNYRFNNNVVSANNTTPEAFTFYGLIDRMIKENVTHVVCEISSHALKLQRVEHLDIDFAIFTNLTPEHLDFHKDMQDYYQSKKRLFVNLLQNSNKNKKFALINIDDNYGNILFNELKKIKNTFELRSYSLTNKNADFYCLDFNIALDKTKAKFALKNKVINIETDLIGKHNLYNILSALAVAFELNLDLDKAKIGIEDIKIIPGRLEKVYNNKGIYIFVDYAHTPDALLNVIKTLNELKKNRLIVVFGCGGDRDRKKRPIMGEIAGDYSDIAIVTSDNPRTEDPEKIIDEIEVGLKKTKNPFIREVLRENAIKKAIEISKPNDIILIAGKGHEDYQIIGKTKYKFSDQLVAKKYLSGL